MAETGNIARMAEIVSDEIFGVFGWQRTGPVNENWTCVIPEHNRKTHPADVVFWYLDPYSTKRIYVTVDLKSYAQGSINTSSINEALRNLAKTTECTQLSDAWRHLFHHRDMAFQPVSLLFVYNHDGAYDKSFISLLAQVTSNSHQLRAGNRMHVLGPRDVCYLKSIANDIKGLRGTPGDNGSFLLPQPNDCSFFYPDLYRHKAVRSWGHPATLETLSGPWQILKYRHQQSSTTGYMVYYRGTGSTRDEFLYLIDFFFHYQLLQDTSGIQIRAMFAANEAAVNFEKAKEEYARAREGEESLLERLSLVSFRTLTTVFTQFSPIEIGMSYD
jgi:hypothetical protein